MQQANKIVMTYLSYAPVNWNPHPLGPGEG